MEWYRAREQLHLATASQTPLSSAKNIDGGAQVTRLLVPARIRGAAPLESEPRRRVGRREFDVHSTAARPQRTACQEYQARDWHVAGLGCSGSPIA